MEPLAISVVEAAKALGISKSMAYALIEQGRLPAVRLGEKRLIVPVKALSDWLEQQADAATVLGRSQDCASLLGTSKSAPGHGLRHTR